MITVFALANGRSGTRFLSHLLRHNLKHAVCRHEPYFDWGNPSMFGKPIEDHTRGNLDRIRQLLTKKKRFIDNRRCDVYVETSHAFLKSYFDLAPECFPHSKFVHLVRHPLKTARSETNREQWLDEIHFPLRHYRSDDGRKLYRWSLTGDEPIYQEVGLPRLTLFQHYVIQWIEVENRAMRFLDDFGKHADCVTLSSPVDLNDSDEIGRMISTLGLQPRGPVQIAGKQNRTPGKKTNVTAQEENEFREVISRMPTERFEIFQRPPYNAYDWISWLQR